MTILIGINDGKPLDFRGTMMGQSQSPATPYLHRPGIASILRRQDMWSKSQGRARGTSCGVGGEKSGS